MDRKGRLRLKGELELRSQQFLLIALFPGATKLLRPSAFASLRGLVVIVALTKRRSSTPSGPGSAAESSGSNNGAPRRSTA